MALRDRIINIGSLAAIVGGLGIGVTIHYVEWPGVDSILQIADVIGKSWLVLLLFLVIPMVSAYMFLAVHSIMARRGLGKTLGRSVVVYFLILFAGILYSTPLGFITVQLVRAWIPSFKPAQDAVPTEEPGISATSAGESLLHILETMQGALASTVLWVMLTVAVSALLISRFRPELSRNLETTAQRMAEWSMGSLQAVLLTLPVAILALLIPVIARTGALLIGVVGVFVIAECFIMTGYIGLFYLFVHLKASVPLRTFSRAVLRPQLVALSTRSTMATLPAMMETAEHKLGLHKGEVGTLIPFGALTFRLHRGVTPPLNFFFMSFLFGIEFSLGMFVAYVFIQLVTSLASPGIPGGGVDIANHVAVGLPAEGYLLFYALEPIPDIFMTLANVTGILTVASISGETVGSLEGPHRGDQGLNQRDAVL